MKAFKVKCPECGALPGERCFKNSARSVHFARQEAADGIKPKPRAKGPAKKFRSHTIACPKCNAGAGLPCRGKVGGNVHWERYAAVTPELEEEHTVEMLSAGGVVLVVCPACDAQVGVKCGCAARWRAARNKRAAEMNEKAQRARHRLRLKEMV